jgi:hypothetical protein
MSRPRLLMPVKESLVERELVYTSAATAEDLASLPAADGPAFETSLARVTLSRRSGKGGLRLAITSNAPFAQGQLAPPKRWPVNSR